MTFAPSTKPDAQTIEEILHFWFGQIDGDWCSEDRNGLWWDGGAEIDAEITERFGAVVERACRSELDAWCETPRGRLALVILLDQFTRNIYRRSPDAFAFDERAREIAYEGFRGSDHHEQLALIERVFLFMPLMHSEALEDHDVARALYEQIADAADNREQAQRYVDAEALHRKIIEEFGRYPHRNRVLGRPSTERELAYMRGGAETFGQD